MTCMAWPNRPIPLAVRLERRHRLTARGCWEWTGRRDRDGYGRMQIGGRAGRDRPVHIVAYELFHGPIPSGLQIDHTCRNRACFCPEHIEAVTPVVNCRRGEPANRTHCPQGHAYDAANTYVHNGKRECRRCKREACARYRRKRHRLPA